MRRSTLTITVALVATLALATPALASGHFWFQGFETDTDGWLDFGPGTIHREMSGYTNAGGYADGIPSAAGDWHARLRNTQSGGCAPPFSSATNCIGPFSGWGKATTTNPTFPAGGYVTEVDVFLDADWADTHSDWRFDFSSAINNSSGNHLRDYVFNAGTTAAGDWIVGSSTNAFRANSFPSNPCPSPSTPPNSCRAPVTITTSGWYTLQHVFYDNGGTLSVDMSILDASGTQVAAWTIHSTDLMATVGGDRYGWFANQEVHDLAIDNSLRRNRTPHSKDDCKDGGWEQFDNPSFSNQGQCIKFVNTGR